MIFLCSPARSVAKVLHKFADWHDQKTLYVTRLFRPISNLQLVSDKKRRAGDNPM
jgi:hypothetical protein